MHLKVIDAVAAAAAAPVVCAQSFRDKPIRFIAPAANAGRAFGIPS